MLPIFSSRGFCKGIIYMHSVYIDVIVYVYMMLPMGVQISIACITQDLVSLMFRALFKQIHYCNNLGICFWPILMFIICTTFKIAPKVPLTELNLKAGCISKLRSFTPLVYFECLTTETLGACQNGVKHIRFHPFNTSLVNFEC